jgi:O-antigen ligase
VLAGGGGISTPTRSLDPRILPLLGLTCVLVAQGVAITQSYLFAAPLLGLLVIALAVDIPLVPFVGGALLLRVLTDGLASSTSRHSSALNPSALIAVLLILVAAGLLARRQRGAAVAATTATWIALWTAIAVLSHGASTVTIREGVREGSILAVAVIVLNARGALTTPVVTRLVQIAGLAAALLALFQLATHSGADISGQVRSNGTFAHPNDAAVYFAVATLASLWRYVDYGKKRLDLLFLSLYAAATIATFSLGGFFGLLVMIGVFGVLRSGSRRLKLGACGLAALLVIVFLATPLGAERLQSESSTELGGAHTHAGATNSLQWRLYKWETLIPEWEQAPLLGRGLGTTITAEATSQNTTVGNLPHSEYVRYLVETGALGILSLLGGLIFLLRRIGRRRLRGDGNAATLALAIVLGLLVNGLAANTLLYTPAAYAAALIVASAFAGAAAANGGRLRGTER